MVAAGVAGGFAREVELVPLFKAPFPPEVSGAGMNRLADEWGDEETLHELGA